MVTDLWFDRDLDDISRRGGMLYASYPGAVWAVLLSELVYPDDVEQESDQILGHFGAFAHGVGHLLLGDGVQLSASLEQWATVPNVPMAQLGSWVPCLVSIDGSAQLALHRDFDGLRVFASTWSARHLTIVTPSREVTATLVHRDDLAVPPPGHDQHGG